MMNARRSLAREAPFLSILVAVAALVAAPGAARAALTLAGEVNPDPAVPGELVDAQVSVANTGPGTTGNLTLRLLWPQHMRGFETITGGGACPGGCDAGDFLVWNLGVLGPGVSVTVAFNDLVGLSVADGTVIPFDFELLDGGVDAAALGLTVEVQSDSPLELAVDPLSDPVAAGGTLVYEVVYGNTGAASASAAELELPLPSGTQFLSATGGLRRRHRQLGPGKRAAE